MLRNDTWCGRRPREGEVIVRSLLRDRLRPLRGVVSRWATNRLLNRPTMRVAVMPLIHAKRKAGRVRYWQYGQAEKSPDLAISDLSRFCPAHGGRRTVCSTVRP